MLTGLKIRAYPSEEQKKTLSQWMGCARFVWNAKCDEDKYLTIFALKYLPPGNYAPVDQTYSQYKNKELSSWLSDCPSQILRNSVTNWFKTYQNFLQGECGKPKRKKKLDKGSIHVTKELFRFEIGEDGEKKLFIGSTRNNIGFLTIKPHRMFEEPKSLYIRKKRGVYYVSFCYDDGEDESNLLNQQGHLDHLKTMSKEFLEAYTVGIDRGVVRPVQAGQDVFDLTKEQKRNKAKHEKYIKRHQKRLARHDKKGSKRRDKTKRKISKYYEKIANIRNDFCHKTSHAIVSNDKIKIMILEDLKIKNMTKRPKPKKTQEGRWERNGARAKAGLNKSIHDQSWYQIEVYLIYKCYRAGKAIFKVSPYQSSQQCAVCDHTDPQNRKSQEIFLCVGCGHTDNADHNAAEVLKKRAIALILHSGTELSKRGVLLRFDIGQGAIDKTICAKAQIARGDEMSKKKRKATKVV
jgi:putative transposase